MEKENVCVETEREAKDVAEAKQVGGGDAPLGKEALAALGKFKDVDALVRAYSSLEAEFTRRSQRLKELEKQAENFEAFKMGAESSGVEKLRKNADAKREERRKFDQFVAEVTSESGLEKTPAVENAEEPAEVVTTSDGVKNAVKVASVVKESKEVVNGSQDAVILDGWAASSLGGKSNASVAENGNAASSAQQLYDLVRENEEVRLKIVGEYLASIGKSGAPITVGGVGAFASPTVKAGTIGDAGKMALRYFKNAAEK